MAKKTLAARTAGATNKGADDRVAALDWAALSGELDAHGCAVIPSLLSFTQCEALAEMYSDEERFRSRVIMSRHGFGRGCSARGKVELLLGRLLTHLSYLPPVALAFDPHVSRIGSGCSSIRFQADCRA